MVTDGLSTYVFEAGTGRPVCPSVGLGMAILFYRVEVTRDARAGCLLTMVQEQVVSLVQHTINNIEQYIHFKEGELNTCRSISLLTQPMVYAASSRGPL